MRRYDKCRMVGEDGGVMVETDNGAWCLSVEADARIATLEAALAAMTAERDRERSTRESLTRSVIAACEGSGCVNAYELRKELDRMTKERDAQAEAVRALGRLAAWMKWNMAELNTDWIYAMNNPIARAAVEGAKP